MSKSSKKALKKKRDQAMEKKFFKYAILITVLVLALIFIVNFIG